MISSDVSKLSEKSPKTAFISYTSADQDLADQLRQHLLEAGVRVWSGDEDLSVGANLRQGIEDGLKNSDVAVIVLSTAAEAAPWTGMELATLIASAASRGHPRLVPVLAERGVEVPLLLSDLVYADASRPEKRDAAIAAVVQAVVNDQPSHEPSLELAKQEISAERFLLDARRSRFEAGAAARWEIARRILAITLVLSLVGLVAVSAFAGIGVLPVAVPAIASLVAAAIGFYFGDASRRRDDFDEAADKVGHGE
jgi:TIR domain